MPGAPARVCRAATSSFSRWRGDAGRPLAAYAERPSGEASGEKIWYFRRQEGHLADVPANAGRARLAEAARIGDEHAPGRYTLRLYVLDYAVDRAALSAGRAEARAESALPPRGGTVSARRLVGRRPWPWRPGSRRAREPTRRLRPRPSTRFQSVRTSPESTRGAARPARCGAALRRRRRRRLPPLHARAGRKLVPAVGARRATPSAASRGWRPRRAPPRWPSCAGGGRRAASARMEADARAGHEPVLLFFYSGHGTRGEDGRAGAGAERRRRSPRRCSTTRCWPRCRRATSICSSTPATPRRWCARATLEAAVGAARRAEDVPDLRCAQPRWRAFPTSARSSPRPAAAQAHEWDAYQRGVFTHEVLSALRGAADVNGDGRIEYSELAAFLAAANREVADPRARPQVVVQPPRSDRRAPIVDLAALGAAVPVDRSRRAASGPSRSSSRRPRALQAGRRVRGARRRPSRCGFRRRAALPGAHPTARSRCAQGEAICARRS